MTPGNVDQMGSEIFKRVAWRLVPFLMLGYLVNGIDRVNVGFAALQMNKDLSLSATVFGFASGIYFVSYFLCEVPSNLALEKYGARRWIARIMISWGIVSAATAFVTGSWSFTTLRFILGAAEAGFFPGVILYLTYWFPQEMRARIIGIFMVATPISGLIGSPISAMLLNVDGWLGLRGWQWLFIGEGLPAVVMGIMALSWLSDGPADAKFLTEAQRSWLVAEMNKEHNLPRPVKKMPLLDVFRNKYVLLFTLIYCGPTAASTGLAIWQPQIVKSFGMSNLATGILVAIPYAIASAAMIYWGFRSDRTRERVWHTTIPILMIALGLAATFLASALWMLVVLLIVILVGVYACKGPFWALSTEYLSPAIAAAALAQINALSNLTGFFTSFLIGWIKTETHSYPLALLPLAVVSLIGAGAVLVVGAAGAKAARNLTAGKQVSTP